MRKIILSIIMFAAIASTSFAVNGGFEFILNVPVGMSVGIYDYDLTDRAENADVWLNGEIRNNVGRNGGVGFDIGVTAQIGYMFKFTDNLGLSVLGEVGYSHDTYSYISKLDKNISYVYSFESIQVGILPKFNFFNFSVGIGAGIKFPMAGNYNSKIASISADTKIDSDYMKRNFKSAVIPYMKFSFDYSIFFTESMAFNIGLYLGYDFGVEPNLYLLNTGLPNWGLGNNVLVVDEVSYSSFDIGLQVGFKFGPNTK